MGELYYILYSDEQKKIYWFMRKEKADNANLRAMQRYMQNHKKTLLAKEIFLTDPIANKIKALLAIDSMWAALEIIKRENPNALSIEYPDSFVLNKS
jgi:hypothetical protein